MDDVQVLLEFLSPLREWHFFLAFLVGFVCIIPPFGIVSSLVINRSVVHGIRSTVPVVLSATLGDALTALIVLSGASYIINFMVGHRVMIANIFLWILLGMGIYRLVNHFRRSPKEEIERPSKHDNWVAFFASLFNPINYVMFGATLLVIHQGQSIGLMQAVSFCVSLLLGCLTAWTVTANYGLVLRRVFSNSEKLQGSFAWVLTIAMIGAGSVGLLRQI